MTTLKRYIVQVNMHGASNHWGDSGFASDPETAEAMAVHKQKQLRKLDRIQPSPIETRVIEQKVEMNT